MKTLYRLYYEGFIMKALQKLYKKVAAYMFLKEHDDFSATICILSKYDWLNIF